MLLSCFWRSYGMGFLYVSLGLSHCCPSISFLAAVVALVCADRGLLGLVPVLWAFAVLRLGHTAVLAHSGATGRSRLWVFVLLLWCLPKVPCAVPLPARASAGRHCGGTELAASITAGTSHGPSRPIPTPVRSDVPFRRSPIMERTDWIPSADIELAVEGEPHALTTLLEESVRRENSPAFFLAATLLDALLEHFETEYGAVGVAVPQRSGGTDSGIVKSTLLLAPLLEHGWRGWAERREGGHFRLNAPTGSVFRFDGWTVPPAYHCRHVV